MTLLSTGSSNLLNRQIHSSNVLSEGQLRLDATLQSFSSQVKDPYLLAGMLAGGLVGRGLRIAGFSSLGALLGESRLAYQGARAGGFALSLAGEAAAFTGTERILRGESFDGFRKSWLHSMINLGSLRVAGLASVGQSQILQRSLNTSAMLAAHQIAGALQIIERPRESLTDQFAQALVMDVQSSMSRHLIDQFLPVVGQIERSLDTRIGMREWSPVSAERNRISEIVSEHFNTISEAYIRLRTKAATFSLSLGIGMLLPRLANAQEHAVRITHETFTLGNALWALGGIAPGLLAGFAYPILKGKYRNYVTLSVALGAGVLAARLGTDFSSLRESAGNIAFLVSAFAFGTYREIWTQRRVNDRERIHFWQHEVPRDQYVKTHVVERTAEEYRAIMDAPPVEIDPNDASWSHESISRGSNGIARDVDAYPETFVRFVHDAPPKSAGFLNGNYFYNRVFDGPRVTATLEQFISTFNMKRAYEWLRNSRRESLRELLIRKFNITYPERFDWRRMDRFGDFFTRPLVTPLAGLSVAEGQTFHDGVLDVVARGNLLDQGIRLAGKGPVVRRKIIGEDGREREIQVVEDAVLPLRQILGRAATRFEGKSQTLIATYLSPRHWHQTLSPVSGTIADIQVIEGFRHTVDPGVRQVREDINFGGRPGSLFQSENARVVVTIDTPEYGPVALVCTAAALVSTSRVFPRIGEQVRVGELLHEYRWGSHNTLVMRSSAVALAPGLVPGRQVYVRGTKPDDADGITELFVPRNRLR